MQYGSSASIHHMKTHTPGSVMRKLFTSAFILCETMPQNINHTSMYTTVGACGRQKRSAVSACGALVQAQEGSSSSSSERALVSMLTRVSGGGGGGGGDDEGYNI